MIFSLVFAGLGVAATAAAPSVDVFTTGKVTLAAPTLGRASAPAEAAHRSYIPPQLIERARVVLAQLQGSEAESAHDDAKETSGAVILTEKGRLHCDGHAFPAVPARK